MGNFNNSLAASIAPQLRAHAASRESCVLALPGCDFTCYPCQGMQSCGNDKSDIVIRSYFTRLQFHPEPVLAARVKTLAILHPDCVSNRLPQRIWHLREASMIKYSSRPDGM